MGTHSWSWFYLGKLVAIISLLAGQSEGATDCQVFSIRCSCSPFLNDRGLEMGDSVDCSSKGLSDIPTPNASYNKPIYELKLNNNNILTLGDNILSSLTITKLDFSGNPISSVNNNTFRSLGRTLKILILSGDSTSKPPSNAFLLLNNLEELTLRDYSVPDLDPEDKYFLSFTNLRHLTVDNWNTRSIHHNSFQLASSSNLLLSLTILNQPMNQLPGTALHSEDVTGLLNLRISGTSIYDLIFDTFSGLTKIKEIDLSSNHIHTLIRGCFIGIEDTLVRLSLANNSLTEQADKLLGLTNLVNLEDLDLSFNSMTAVPDLSKLGTSKPLNLLLNNNRISSVMENSFAGLSGKLRLLDLSRNEIHTIQANSFAGATQLEVLSLSAQSGSSNNPLQLPLSLAQTARTLKELYVDGQEIDPSTLWSLLWQLNMLEVLNLSSTRLTFIPDEAFFNLTNLKRLDLSNNRLNQITQNMLAGPRNLKFVSLTGNLITTLSSCAFFQFTGFPTLAMGNIFLDCDCAVKWMWNLIQNKSITFIPGQEAQCRDGKTLASKTIEEFCSSPFTEPQCNELYSPLKLSITLGPFTSGNVLVSWQLPDTKDFKSFTIIVTNSNSREPVFQQNFTALTTSYTLTILLSNVDHTVCVTALFYTGPSILACRHIVSNSSAVTTEHTSDPDNKETGIIIGVVIGGVVLLGIVAAIVYLVFFHRKHKEKGPNNVPVQPRNFSKSELPSMNEETRTFSKPKKPRVAGTPEQREGMQVVAISDGQTSNLRVGRAELMASSGSLRTTRSKPSSNSSYENDRGPLPAVPARPPSEHVPAGYYNMGYKDDKYDEIGNGKESNL